MPGAVCKICSSSRLSCSVSIGADRISIRMNMASNTSLLTKHQQCADKCKGFKTAFYKEVFVSLEDSPKPEVFLPEFCRSLSLTVRFASICETETKVSKPFVYIFARHSRPGFAFHFFFPSDTMLFDRASCSLFQRWAAVQIGKILLKIN